MSARPRAVVAAGHPVSARAGADVLRAGGNAVDAALGAMLAALSCEPLLTGLGAGGFMLVAGVGEAQSPPVLLDFFVEAPGRDRPASGGSPAALEPVEISFAGDALQVFHVGAASVGTYGFPAGVQAAAQRFGTIGLAELCAPAAALARGGVRLGPEQAHIVEILAPIVTSTPQAAALFAPGGRLVGAGDTLRWPELGDALDRLGADGAAPFYTGDIAAAIIAWLGARGGLVGAADLAAYAVIEREPLRLAYRGREVLTNPPPSPGGLLLARALMALDGAASPPSVTAIAQAMRAAQSARTPAFAAELHDAGFAARFLGAGATGGAGGHGDAGDLGRGGSRLGSTTHVAALDAAGGACSVTCSNGSASGVIVPGTGVHLNNMLGESDLNPDGFHRHPPGRRMPSMMSPTIVRRGGVAELALGSAGSNRIRSAILQTIVRSVDEGLDATAAVRAPRLHYEDGIVFAEPGVDADALQAAGFEVRRFRSPNLFFGGAQAVARDAAGSVSGGGDPRRGGAAELV